MFDRTALRVRHGEGMERAAVRLLWGLALLAAGTLARQMGWERYGEMIPHGVAVVLDVACGLFLAGLAVRLVVRLLAAPSIPRFVRDHAFYLLGLGYLLVRSLSASPPDPANDFASVLLRVGVLVELAASWIQLWLLRSRPRPAVLLITSFLVVIALGSAVLSLPKATWRGIAPTDAVFTATSATCVTGLIVKNTGGDFTPFGQTVILILMQIGGLGLMTFVGFFSILLGRELGVGGGVVLREALNQASIGAIGRLLRSILLVTLGAEILGAGALYLLDPIAPPAAAAPADRLYHCVFHSVSAFCNAGFCLNADSYVRAARGALAVQGVLILLIVVGGIGFTVIADVGRFLWAHLRRRSPRPSLRTHSRIVLVTSAVLIALGWALLLAIEWGRAFQHLRPAEKLTAALFQSVTARTAGLNTIPIHTLAPASLFLLMAWMFVGASPGSTGGGVKTSTLAILLLSIWARIRGRGQVEVGGRQLPGAIVRSVVTLVGAAAILLGTSIFLLLVLEGERLPFQGLVYEAVSAFGTVGLSTGVTTQLSSAARWVIIFTMFAGRLGPLTLVVSMTTRRSRTFYHYPTAHVMVG